MLWKFRLFLESHPGVAGGIEFWVCSGLPFGGVVIFWSVFEISRSGECVELSGLFGQFGSFDFVVWS